MCMRIMMLSTNVHNEREHLGISSFKCRYIYSYVYSTNIIICRMVWVYFRSRSVGVKQKMKIENVPRVSAQFWQAIIGPASNWDLSSSGTKLLHHCRLMVYQSQSFFVWNVSCDGTCGLLPWSELAKFVDPVTIPILKFHTSPFHWFNWLFFDLLFMLA